MSKPVGKTIFACCLIASLALTYVSFQMAYAAAMSGADPWLLLHVGAFVVAVVLVLVAVIVRYKAKI